MILRLPTKISFELYEAVDGDGQSGNKTNGLLFLV